MARYAKHALIKKCFILLILTMTVLLCGCTDDGSDNLARTYSNSIGMEFVLIPEGDFYMGSDSTPMVAFDGPAHPVRISEPFYMGKYEVTQEEWTSVMGEDPSFFEGSDLPVEQVSWNDAQEFVDRLNEMENTDKYRLPTEAEWEYACRAGTTSRFSFTDKADDLDEYGWSDSYGWCAINSDRTTQPVGTKEPNQWGLYDMHGNVWEWTQDTWQDNYEGAPDDGSAWENGDLDIRVGRGGSWMDGPNICQSAFRGQLDADNGLNVLGLRIVREV